MNIVVNTRFLLKDQLEGYGYFIKEVFGILCPLHPEHEFYFLFDRPYDPSFLFSPNVHPLVVPPPARHPVLWKYWYDVKVPGVLKKLNADVFVSPDGFCSLRTRVPQCMVIHDIGVIHHPGDYRRSHSFYYRRYIPAFLKKADRVATVSELSRRDILDACRIDPEKISVVYSAAKEVFRPLDPDTQAGVREKWTGGKAFFMYLGAIHPRKNLVNLLKAFSVFKKRQQSGMKLVLCGRLTWKNQAFLDLLKTYKYREDVVLTGYLDERELTELLGAAYALVYPSTFEGFGVPVLEAMRCGVPALTSKNSSMQEIAGEAGLYFDPHDPADMAEKLMLIYKDEDLRHRLIEKGRPVAAAFTWQRTASLLWKCIMQAAKKVNIEPPE